MRGDMDQTLALGILLAGKSALLTGAAGSGKTYLLNQFIRLSRASGKHVSVTATTGLAATHLGGTTIHSWSGIGIRDGIDEHFVEHMSKARTEIITKTDILIIDEISMLHDYRLDMVDFVCRLVRKQLDVPFGGIQVVMSGDFFQLPPINRRDSILSGGFVTHSEAWRQLRPVILYLSEQHRQDDGSLLAILSGLRSGNLLTSHVESLYERSSAEPPDDDMTELYTVNLDVDRINNNRLRAVDGELKSYHALTTGSANYVETLARSVLAPLTLELKPTALVMAVRNDPAHRYSNGSIGRVITFEPGTNFPVVEFRNGREVTVGMETWEMMDGDKKRASISQVPLRLAYAITVHKSQGMTLDAAKMDLRKAFTPGMGYVALSRVRRIDDLYLAGFNRMALSVSEEARQLDDVLMEASNQAARQYAELINLAQKAFEQKPDDARKPAGTWQAKIAKMRETYPNAYKPWTAAQDAALKTGFQNGETISSLSATLGRHEGSIKMRLQKHFGEDMVL